MDVKYLKNVILYTLSALVSICIILYVGYHLVNTWGVKVSTTHVELVSANQTISLDAYIMRDETVLYSDTSGNLGQTAANGEKVKKNQEVAKIYSNPDTEIRTRLNEIDTQLELLEESAAADYLTVSDTSKLDSSISDMLLKMKLEIENNNLDRVSAMRSELLSIINRRNLITQTGLSSVSLGSQISALQSERKSLVSQLSTVLSIVKTNNVSGYYYAPVDGYENIFSASKVSTMTLIDFWEMMSSPPETEILTGGQRTTSGKIVTDYEWYIACPSTKDSLALFEVNKTYHITFPNNPEYELDMTLTRIISQTDSQEIVLIFKTTYMPDGFNYLRLQPVEIVEVIHTGYKVPLSAVRMVDGIQGVYIMEGSLVRFKRIEVIYETDGYFIVSQETDKDTSEGRWLSLHDKIILEGKALFEGKIIR